VASTVETGSGSVAAHATSGSTHPSTTGLISPARLFANQTASAVGSNRRATLTHGPTYFRSKTVFGGSIPQPTCVPAESGKTSASVERAEDTRTVVPHGADAAVRCDAFDVARVDGCDGHTGRLL